MNNSLLAIGRIEFWSIAREPSDLLADCANSGNINAVAAANLELYVDFSRLPFVDQSGNATPLVFENGPQFSVLEPALLLNGSAWADVGDAMEVGGSMNNSFTIDGWFNVNGFATLTQPQVKKIGTLVSRSNPMGCQYRVQYQYTPGFSSCRDNCNSIHPWQFDG
jgi:hypothetical protein